MKRYFKLVAVWSTLAAVLACPAAQGNAQTFTTLHYFGSIPDGAVSAARMTFFGNTFYGTAKYGGTNDSGTVFAVSTDGTSFSVLHTFAPYVGLSGTYYNSDGVGPDTELLLADDVLYGTTVTGGTNAAGTVFAVRADGTGFTNLYIFAGGNDGSYVGAGLTLSGNTLYGVAASGGTNGTGTIFSINTDGSGFFNLHSFAAYPDRGLEGFTNNDGINPEGTLLLFEKTLYGTTLIGGTNRFGTIFSVGTNGSNFTVLHTFGTNEGPGSRSGLILADHTLYGTGIGGSYNDGTVFAINTDGTCFRKLHDFTGGNDGSEVWGGLVLSGNTLYGTTAEGGTNGNGTIFCIRTDGIGFANLYTFSAESPSTGTNSDGASPFGGLVMLNNTLYGTTAYGGDYQNGTIFSLTLPLPPDLNLASAGTNVILTWPTNSITYTLQSATSLVPPVVWNPVSPSPAIANGQNTVTNPLAGTQMFYRLSQ